MKDQCCFIPSSSPNEKIVLDPRLSVINKKILLSGKIRITDMECHGGIRISLKDKESKFTKLLSNESPIYLDGWYFLLESRIKFRVCDDYVEYSEM